MIFQELSDAPDLTVAENIRLGQWPGRRGFVSWRGHAAPRPGMLDELGVELDLDADGRARCASGERQVVEIARALSARRRRCLILDEPTAALSLQEVERLFGFVARLRDAGRGARLHHPPARRGRRHRRRRRRAARRRSSPRGPAAGFAAPGTGHRDGRPRHRRGDPAGPGRHPWRARRWCVPGREFAGRPSRDLNLCVARRRGRLPLRQGRLRHRRGRRGGVRPPPAHRGRARASAAAPAGSRPRQRDRRRGRASSPADRQREGAFMVRSVGGEPRRAVLAAARARRGVLHPARIEARRLPALARRAQHPLAQRPRPADRRRCRAATSRRCCSAGGWSAARGVLVLVEPTRGVDVGARAEIYRSIRRARRRRRRACSSPRRLRGGRPARGPRRGHGPRAGHRVSSPATRSRRATHRCGRRMTAARSGGHHDGRHRSTTTAAAPRGRRPRPARRGRSVPELAALVVFLVALMRVLLDQVASTS